MKSLLLIVTLLFSALAISACSVFGKETGFSVVSSHGDIQEIRQGIVHIGGEINRSYYKFDTYSLFVDADPVVESTQWLGICPLPIIPIFGLFDDEPHDHLSISLVTRGNQKNLSYEFHLLKANIEHKNTYYTPVKIKKEYRINEKYSSHTEYEIVSLPLSISKEVHSLNLEYLLNPQTIDDFTLDLEATISHSEKFKDNIHFKKINVRIFGCIP